MLRMGKVQLVLLFAASAAMSRQGFDLMLLIHPCKLVFTHMKVQGSAYVLCLMRRKMSS